MKSIGTKWVIKPYFYLILFNKQVHVKHLQPPMVELQMNICSHPLINAKIMTKLIPTPSKNRTHLVHRCLWFQKRRTHLRNTIVPDPSLVVSCFINPSLPKSFPSVAFCHQHSSPSLKKQTPNSKKYYKKNRKKNDFGARWSARVCCTFYRRKEGLGRSGKSGALEGGGEPNFPLLSLSATFFAHSYLLCLKRRSMVWSSIWWGKPLCSNFPVLAVMYHILFF